MPELPDVLLYLESLRTHVLGHRLDRLKIVSPFVLRSVTPPIESIDGQVVTGLRRIGKRLVFEFRPALVSGSSTSSSDERPLFLVLHLMIAGRLRWRTPLEKPAVAPKMLLATFEFEHGRLLFTEAGSKKRASLQLFDGEAALAAVDPGGAEPLEITREQFHEALSRENHTLKRALTDPHLFSGIGNAYSDEILHLARLSPVKLTRSLTDAETARLYEATRATLTTWIDRLRDEAGGAFPEKVTAFRDQMAVHGRFKLPCPVCGSPVQRIVYADNECNYCATCQTEGRLLADRSLSRLLKSDWPKKLE
jgi:formamidopyrimidine-DNA glycosylase